MRRSGIRCRATTVREECHDTDVIMSTMASQITSLAFVYSTVYSGADQRNIKAPRQFPAQKASHTENISIWWRHHGLDDMWSTLLSGCCSVKGSTQLAVCLWIMDCLIPRVSLMATHLPFCQYPISIIITIFWNATFTKTLVSTMFD